MCVQPRVVESRSPQRVTKPGPTHGSDSFRESRRDSEPESETGETESRRESGDSPGPDRVARYHNPSKLENANPNEQATTSTRANLLVAWVRLCISPSGNIFARMRFVTTSNALEVVTKRAFLAKNDTGRRAVSKCDAWAMHPPKDDTRPICWLALNSQRTG